MSRRSGLRVAAGGLLALVVLLALCALVLWLNLRGESAAPPEAAGEPATPAQVARGAYLALAGNCAGCHTARGGAPYAGGRGIETPFGTVYAGNLTPDVQTGLGGWTRADFWRALHHGRSRDGRLLVPAFPYPNYTQVTRDDADALFAWLQSLPPVQRPRPPHGLRFPYDTQAALAVWRALFFRAGEFVPDPTKDAVWNRGAYLVAGLGHCAACHAPRNAFGATTDSPALGGGLIPMQKWYAPSLASPREAGVADWPQAEVVQLLKTGSTERGRVLGPMAEVVLRSTQHLADDDLQALATYLRSLPPRVLPAQRGDAADAATLAAGRQLYEKHCEECHGKAGKGAAGAYAALAGNRVVTMDSPANLVRIIVGGGFAPATAGHPRPYGMPPFGHVLSDAEIAALASWLRRAWGHEAPAVGPLLVQALR